MFYLIQGPLVIQLKYRYRSVLPSLNKVDYDYDYDNYYYYYFIIIIIVIVVVVVVVVVVIIIIIIIIVIVNCTLLSSPRNLLVSTLVLLSASAEEQIYSNLSTFKIQLKEQIYAMQINNQTIQQQVIITPPPHPDLLIYFPPTV